MGRLGRGEGLDEKNEMERRWESGQGEDAVPTVTWPLLTRAESPSCLRTALFWVGEDDKKFWARYECVKEVCISWTHCVILGGGPIVTKGRGPGFKVEVAVEVMVEVKVEAEVEVEVVVEAQSRPGQSRKLDVRPSMWVG